MVKNTRKPPIPSKVAVAVTHTRPVTQVAAATQVQVQRHEFSGPIPPPELLARYNDIVPNAAERILSMAEREAAHRQQVERDVTASNIDSQSRAISLNELRAKQSYKSDRTGQVLGAIVSMLALGGSVYLAMHGQAYVAALIAALPVASLIRAFTLRTDSVKKPDEKKQPQKTTP